MKKPRWGTFDSGKAAKLLNLYWKCAASATLKQAGCKRTTGSFKRSMVKPLTFACQDSRSKSLALKSKGRSTPLSLTLSGGKPGNQQSDWFDDIGEVFFAKVNHKVVRQYKRSAYRQRTVMAADGDVSVGVVCR